jgi:hypothetical protein
LTTDLECRLYEKSKGGAKPGFEREAAIEMITQIPWSHRITVGADEAFDVPDIVKKLRRFRVTPHVSTTVKN